MGLRPRVPVSAAGCLTDPPVSVPSEIGACPAHTATAEPPLEPPATLDVSQGFKAGPKAEFSLVEPIANSSKLVLPSMIAPASSNFDTTVD